MAINSFEGTGEPVQLPSAPSNAHTEDEVSDSLDEASMPIAIIGMGFRGPEDATNLEKLWKMILEGREAWSQIPESRWNSHAFYHPDHARHGTTNVQGGHFLIEDVSLFDAPFFNMTSDEAAAMDPQQRLLLEVTYEGLENAGIPLPEIMGSQTSCFVGSFNADYTDLLLRDPDAIPMYQCTNAGQSRAMMANRVSYFFDLKGPSITVDTACSGSLVALHLACQTLRTGDAAMAIAAGVNVILSHEFMSTMTMMKFLSPDGRCYTFDEEANGYARGEGIGCLILKPLKDAIRDKDPIRAVIRGSGSNQDGRTPGITLPSGASQEALIRHVYSMAGLHPHDTEFVETHGTGTQAGDPIETGALARVFCADRNSDKPLRIGSIKTNVGHLEGTSGVAGVIKAVLMLENRTFLPNRNFTSLNPRILLDEWKLKAWHPIQLNPEPWESTGPHRVSVNSFGYGGSNAHVILEDTYGYLQSHGLQELVGKPRAPFLNNALEPSRTPNGRHDELPIRTRLFILSGFDDHSITKQIEKISDYLRERESISDDQFMSNLAFTLNQRRTTLMCRAAATGNSAASVVRALEGNIKVRKATRKPVVGFVFTGQGAQWCGMGRELVGAYPVFRQSMERIDAHLTRLEAPFSALGEILENEDTSRLNHPLHSQTICTALQIALVDLLDSWDIQPDSVTGHSSGEIAAAYAIGALSMEDAISVAYYRGIAASKLSNNKEAKGGMLAAGVSPAQIQPFLDTLETGKAVLACINSPSSVTVSGDVEAIDELEKALKEKEFFCRRLVVDVAYHSHHMELVGGEYLDLISNIRPRIGSKSGRHPVSFFSSVTGAEVKASDLGSQYWTRNLLGQVKFVDSVRALCFETSTQKTMFAAPNNRRARRPNGTRKVTVDVLLEVGPHRALSGPIRQILKDDNKLHAAGIQYASALTRKVDSVTTTLEVTGILACLGSQVNFSAINNPLAETLDTQVMVDLPPYAWNHSRSYWAESRISTTFRKRKHPRTDLLGTLDRMSCPFEPRWRNFVRVSEIPWLKDHKIQSNIVYPAAGYIAMAIEAASQHLLEQEANKHMSAFLLRDVEIRAALVIQENSAAEVMTSLRACQGSTEDFERFYEFNVYSVTAENRWTEHCRGLVGVLDMALDTEYETGFQTPEEPSDLSVIDISTFYEKLASIGLEYGPCFANLTHASSADNLCFAEVTIPDTAAVMPMNFQYPYLVHPCTLDSVFHSTFVQTNMANNPAIPVHIDELCVSRCTERSPGAKMQIETHIDNRTRKDVVASITVMNSNDIIAMSIRGLRCMSLESSVPKQPLNPTDRLGYMQTWKADPDLLSRQDFSTIFTENNQDSAELANRPSLEKCASYYIRTAIQDLKSVDKEELHPDRRQQLEFLVDRTQESCLAPSSDMNAADIHAVSASGPEGRLLTTMGKQLNTFLKDPKFSATDMDPSIWEEYWDDIRSGPAYETLASYIELVGYKNPMISILEVEGTFGQSSQGHVERLLSNNGKGPICSEYTITHQDPSIPDHFAPVLSKWNQSLKVKTLNLNQSPETQGFSKYQYDVVLAPLGLCTVPSKLQALRNIHSLLKPQGHLIIVDPIAGHDNPVGSVIFANSPGCWSIGRFGYTLETWNVMLSVAGFAEAEDASTSRKGPFMIITHPLHEQSIPKRSMLIISEDGDNGIDLSTLQDSLSPVSSDIEIADFTHAKPEGRVCIVLSALSRHLMAEPTPEELEVLRRIFLKALGVLWVTRGAEISPVTPDGALATGFVRTSRSESGIERIVTLDLDGQNPLSSHRAAEVICTVVRERILAGENGQSDTEYAERNGVLLIPRIVENQAFNRSLAASHETQTTSLQNFHQEGRFLKATIPDASREDEVLFMDDSRMNDLPADHIRVHTYAVCIDKLVVNSLEDHDTSQVLATSFGVSGIVQGVGDAVYDFAPGDRVACFAQGAVANCQQEQALAFQKLPEDLSFEAAAALPAAYCTALYALQNLGRVASSDRILVYGATGTVGQALAELCLHVGADVLFVVRAEKDRHSLGSTVAIPDDRIIVYGNGAQARKLLRMKQHQRFDVVINFESSDNEMLQLLGGLVGTGGKFIHLYHENRWSQRRWAIPQLDNAVSFATLDINKLLRDKPTLLYKTWGDVMRMFRAGHIRGSNASAAYSISDMLDALNALRSKDLDSIIIAAKPEDLVKVIVPKPQAALLHPDASYILVGGLGGIGRATALWMADNGARTLIFVNRSGPSSQAAQETARDLKQKGVRAIVHACDISDSKQVEKMVTELERNAPPIRGVIQSAMVLRDVHIEKMTIEDYLSVLRPKYYGTWNLHRHLPDDLDFFVMLSSISGIIGNATQAAYAAGSTFLDAFAVYRSSLGLPAVSLDLGVITDVGYLAGNRDLAAKMAQQGFHGTDTATLMSLIAASIRAPFGEGGTSQIITGLGEWKDGQSLSNFDAPLFAHFRRQFQHKGGEDQSDEFIGKLRENLREINNLGEASGVIYSALSGKIAAHLSVPIESIVGSHPITEYGIDSHMAVELRNWIAKTMESTVPILDILASSTLLDLAGKIASKSRLVHLGE
ncbi:putative polyketide synthase [Aspergillus novofumigatus IBT 16806]|uniref:Putative polyketide synthase n=1 Tax=Aspergillus novofumigatus (strain IBT 16806) TaxID=1392255 RepID=A0A2I1BVE8_ASPN1|nr:putative polyketide synthase [Aspergillus novofumigatus IBT 16806]PKX89349.1 putative polyketide synthase [Aspergillus novofumigatus IBT 16806]